MKKMSEWQDKSNFEINKAVASIVCDGLKVDDGKVFGRINRDGVINVSTIVDYCNNPQDAWPIILENKIAIEPIVCFGDLWQANIKHHKEVCANPLRAAMIAYLEMKGVKPNE